MSSQNYYYSKQQAPRKSSVQQETIAGTMFTGSTNLNDTLNLTLKVFRGRFTDFLVPQLLTYSPLVVGFPFIFSRFGNLLMDTNQSAKASTEIESVVAMTFWFLAILLVFSFFYPFSSIVNSRIASDELHKGNSTWREELKDKFWTRYWLMVFSLAIVNVTMILCIGIVLIIVVLIGGALMSGSNTSTAGLFAAGFLTVVITIVMVIFAVSVPFLFYLIEPICAIEEVSIRSLSQLLIVGPIDQIKRTWRLVKPNFFKFLGISIVVLIIMNFIQSIFLIPVNVGAGLYEIYQSTSNGTMNPGDFRILWVEIIKQSAATAVTIIFAPVYSILKTVLYYQTRIEKENYDLDLMLVNLPEPPEKKSIVQQPQEFDPAW